MCILCCFIIVLHISFNFHLIFLKLNIFKKNVDYFSVTKKTKSVYIWQVILWDANWRVWNTGVIVMIMCRRWYIQIFKYHAMVFICWTIYCVIYSVFMLMRQKSKILQKPYIDKPFYEKLIGECWCYSNSCW